MKFKKLFLVLPLALIFPLCGCSENPYIRTNEIKVTVADGEQYYLRKNTYTVERGDDLTVTVVFRDGYIPDGCSYENYELIKILPDEYNLILYDIKYPEFIKLGETNAAEAVRYYANGGEYTGGQPVEGYIKGELSKTHLRTNTDLGYGIKREGYVQTGWNTMPDGSGERVGLGSRITAMEEGATSLFAQWEKITDDSFFEYEIVSDAAYLTEYTGGETGKLVLPDTVDGYPVQGISEGFCKDLDFKSLVLPRTVKKVAEGAFVNCRFGDTYLFDNLYEVSDGSFLNCTVGSVHINAAEYPRYQSNTEISYFADAVDRLITLRDKKKLIFFSGCSFAYGLRSDVIAREAGSEFQVINMGIIGGTNAGFQFDIISQFTGEGDVLVHAPEAASPYQLMADNGAEIRMFVVTEGNYDLLSLVDVSEIDGFFTSFSAYCKNRAQLDPESYESSSGNYNEFGDIIKPREFTGKDRAFTEDFSYSFKPEFVNPDSAALLCGYYEKLQNRGVEIAFSFSPINYHGLPPADRETRNWEEFGQNCEKLLHEEHGVTIISSVEDYIFAGRYFYDSDYHLNDEGAKLRTERLIRDLKAHGILGGRV